MNDERFDRLLDKAFERNANKDILSADAEEFMVSERAGARVKSRTPWISLAALAAAAVAIAAIGISHNALKHLESSSETVPGAATIINEYTPKHLYDEAAIGDGSELLSKPYCFDYDTAINNIYVGGIKLNMPLTVNSLLEDFDIYSDIDLGDERYVSFKPKGCDDLAFTIIVDNIPNYRNSRALEFFINDEHRITSQNAVSIQGIELGMNELDIMTVWGSKLSDEAYDKENYEAVYATDGVYPGSSGRAVILEHSVNYVIYESDNGTPYFLNEMGKDPIHAIRITFYYGKD